MGVGQAQVGKAWRLRSRTKGQRGAKPFPRGRVSKGKTRVLFIRGKIGGCGVRGLIHKKGSQEKIGLRGHVPEGDFGDTEDRQTDVGLKPAHHAALDQKLPYPETVFSCVKWANYNRAFPMGLL